MFDHCWNFEKASLSVRILKRDVSFKISDVKSVEKLEFENVFWLEFWEERGEKLMTCHLFLDNFSWNFMTFCFSKVKSFETIFSLKKKKLKYLDLDIMKCSCFLNLVFSQKTFCCRKLIVFSCLQFADCYIWPRILSCGVVLCFNHFLRNLSLWKVFVKKVMVLSKTCVRFRNRIFKRFE